ncbi:CRISPR-associated endoribonuclease Cas6 [Calothrix rhizosoleniae]|uniref:CRISPR-associated endoribonuclease Cas6 n=1 Tax=Calothrix rhizosoleniae TaxID=888997 RepID=UPI000B4A52DB|nr:CRISPR-associated endoribonuclease Cas6 [Calothrix rhizosoleniae]
MEPEIILQPEKSTNLYSLVVELAAAEKGKIPATLSRAIHGLVLQWLQQGSPTMAKLVHSSQTSPISLSGLLGNRRHKVSQPGDKFDLRICLLDGNLIEPLLDGLQQQEHKPVILAKFPFVIRNIYTLPGTHRLAEATDYGLLAKAPAMKNIELNFLSPTSFKQSQGIQTFLLPKLVFSSLLRRWNAFAPEAYKFADIEWIGLVSAYELKTHALKMEGGAEIGAQGWVRYGFKDEKQAQIAAILANFAFFSGVGRKTSMGMGQTRISNK